VLSLRYGASRISSAEGGAAAFLDEASAARDLQRMLDSARIHGRGNLRGERRDAGNVVTNCGPTMDFSSRNDSRPSGVLMTHIHFARLHQVNNVGAPSFTL